MKFDSFIGWDIGGAHLKMAHIDNMGRVIAASQLPTPIWQGLDKLENSFSAAKKYFPDSIINHSITTTAELSDIFSDRRTGLAELVRVITGSLEREKINFYAGNTGWVEINQTDKYANEIASANWHATASFVAGKINDGILVDIGSTTTDIIPFRESRLVNQGYTDYERLSCRELVYTGITRTPVMAIVNELPLDSKQIPLIPEHFATMADVYRLTGNLQEEDDMMPAADGAGKSVFESARRLARMVAVDIYKDSSFNCWIETARYIADRQQTKINSALDEVMANAGINQPVLVGAGAGRFMVKELAQKKNYTYIDFADLLDTTEDIKPYAARSAAAVAVAQLSRWAN